MTIELFRALERALVRRGYSAVIVRARAIAPPRNAEDFVGTIATRIAQSAFGFGKRADDADELLGALRARKSAATFVRHKKKATAIDRIWVDRQTHLRLYLAAPNPRNYLTTLPGIGPKIAVAIASDFGLDVLVDDPVLEPVAAAYGMSQTDLCRRIACDTHYHIGGIQLILKVGITSGILAPAGDHVESESGPRVRGVSFADLPIYVRRREDRELAYDRSGY
jgi:hypothetical protein